MRWIDKPRKKTRKEIVLEYIKFMKIMGYYHKLIAYMYKLSKDNRTYAFIHGQYRCINVVSHKQNMISYLETELRNHCRSSKLNEWVFMYYFFRYPLCMGVMEAHDMAKLLFSYFKEKHIDNCIIID